MLVAKCRKILECIVLLGGKRMKSDGNVDFDVGIGSVGRNPVANIDIGSVGMNVKFVKNAANRICTEKCSKSQRPTGCTFSRVDLLAAGRWLAAGWLIGQ